MSRLPPNYTENVRLIQTIRSLPLVGHRLYYGYTVTAIADEYNVLFPATPLTLGEVAALLIAGARRGIYLLVGCSTNVATECGTTPDAENSYDNQLYTVNTAMASINPQNAPYVMVPFDPTVASLGYLPCGACVGGGDKMYNPYSGAGGARHTKAVSQNAGGLSTTSGCGADVCNIDLAQ